VFFMQGRVGLRGRTFRLITFRTTRVEDCASGDTIVRDNESRVLQPPPRSAAGPDGLGAGQRRLLDEHRRVTHKLCYDIKHLSFAFDLRILFDTVKFVLSGKKPG
jgi:lipopolysaccharide/colanic/teichoic acid biosynthesis glycosyltransferase